MLTTDILAKTVGADPLDIQSTFVGAVCRWQAANPAGLVDITRFWYEQGSLDNERKVAQNLKYQIESRSISGVPSIVMRTNDPNGACGVASDAAGVVGWWINPQAPGIDACAQAIKLMELTLATNSLVSAGHVECHQFRTVEREARPALRHPQDRDPRRRELHRDPFDGRRGRCRRAGQPECDVADRGFVPDDQQGGHLLGDAVDLVDHGSGVAP